MNTIAQIRNALVLLCVAALGVSGAAAAQAPVTLNTSRMATRAELETSAGELDQLAASTAYGERIRGDARRQATEVRRRLVQGDFKPGDRISVRIEGQLTVNDTLTVLDGQRLAVPSFRQVSLVGVLRSELESMLRTELTEVVRNATVTVRPLMRLAVFGSVLRPGYVSVPSETTIDAMLMIAGGPAPDAGVSAMTITRADTLLFTAAQTQSALSSGRTVGELGMTDGDALVVPLRARWDRAAVLQVVGLFLTPLLTIFVINR